jgi:hypothetical protein
MSSENVPSRITRWREIIKARIGFFLLSFLWKKFEEDTI